MQEAGGWAACTAGSKLRNNRTLHPISFGFYQIKKYVFHRPLPFQVISESIHFNRKFKPWIEFILNLHLCNQSAIEIIQAVPALLWKRPKNRNAEKMHNFKWCGLYFGCCSTRYINTLGWLDRGRVAPIMEELRQDSLGASGTHLLRLSAFASF